MPSNPDEDESEELKETMIEQKNKMGAKNEEAGKTETEFTPSDKGGEESKESKEALTEQENEYGAKTEVAGKTLEDKVRCSS